MAETATAPVPENLTAALPEDSPIRELLTGALVGPDPYSAYRRMREAGIVSDQGTHVTRYDDALAVLRHPKVSSDARNSGSYQAASGLLDPSTRAGFDSRSFMNTDPPDHTRLRRLVTKAFTPRRIARLRPMVQHFVEEAIDKAAERGRMDVVADLAYPLPVHTISSLLGIPAEHALQLIGGGRPQLCCDDSATLLDLAPDLADEAQRSRQANLDYYAGIVAERRNNPGEDLISALIAARDGEDRLTDDELVNTVRLLFIGGHETTVSLVANGVFALLRHPEQLRLLQRRPGLAGEAVQETLRYDAPFQFAHRTAMADLNINGATVEAGAHVTVWLAAANRDPEQFPDPDTFDLDREDKRHLAFGAGIHACLGMALATMQGEIALRTLTQRLVDPVLLTDDPPYHDDAVHALKALPIAFSDVRDA